MFKPRVAVYLALVILLAALHGPHGGGGRHACLYAALAEMSMYLLLHEAHQHHPLVIL